MKLISCNNCGAEKFSFILEKESSLNELFTVVKCKKCGLVQVNPQPTFEEVGKYYSDEYFTKRTDRGYDNYYSDKIKNEIERVFTLNLQDLGFFEWEKTLYAGRSTIDVGCAAGYFVNFLRNRGWDASGIEIAEGPVNFARKELGLNVFRNDFLEWDTGFSQKFDLITLWASIEHLHKPKETLKKIFKHLRPGGRIIVSTCRYGILAKIRGKNWRYMNVPEHLYYYSLKGLISQCEGIGFKLESRLTYGSGMTSRKDASLFFRLSKYFLDRFVKITNQGDMMALMFKKEN
ncbi:MAG: class I SAM-dependent methyltransferase [Leptospira sp.]|nr:class I SAM-dependent methyltransferase [Leptospira sp.]